MNRIFKNAIVFIGGVLLMTLSSATVIAQEDYESGLEAKIRTLVPSAKSIAISETPLTDLLQVQIDNEIYYASADGKYLVIGRIMDMNTRVNLTDQAKSAVRKDLLSELDRSSQISFAPEAPEHELLVFTDIDCGYCRKLHDQIDEYMAEGIAIHYAAFPRAGLTSHSFEKYVSVWCADDQKSALTLAKSGDEPEPMQCENPVGEQFELGSALGVTGTPALVTNDGILIPGYMPPAQLKARLLAIESAATQAE